MVLPSFEKLLHDFRELPRAEPHEPTLLEIAWEHCKEQVATNLLKFFLDPSREHEWGTLLLRALLGVRIDGDSVEFPPVVTEKGNRLDLVIKSNSFVVGIENKIEHDPCGNPFQDYMSYLKALCHGSDRKPLLILLTPGAARCPNVQVPMKYVTYEELFQAVEGLLGDSDIDQNSRYVEWWQDFRQTLGEANVDEDLVKFVRALEHPDDWRDLLVRVEKSVRSMQARTQDVTDDANEHLEGRHKCAGWRWWGQEAKKKEQLQRKWRFCLFDSCCVRLEKTGVAPYVYVQAALYFGAGWEIQTFATNTVAGLPQPPSGLKQWLEDKGIQEIRNSELLEKVLAYRDILPENEDPGKVAKRFCELIDIVDGVAT